MRFANKPAGRGIVMSVLVTFATWSLLPTPLLAQTAPTDETVYKKFETVVKLRADGEYERAIEQLTQMIKDYSDTEKVLKEAYDQLVWTLHEKGDREAAREAARGALLRFPGHSAETVQIPAWVNDYYDDLRGEMFGSLRITEPEKSRVFLDGQHVGETPLDLPYVRIGEHQLTLTKSGYNDKTEPIAIEPGQPLVMQVSLERKRDKKWWGWRIGAGVVAVAGIVAVAVGLGGKDETPPPVEPLPDPPAPPAN